jgi:pyroglutamyl-peptidase
MILITGFSPFNKRLKNASEMLAELLSYREDVRVKILPVVYKDCFESLAQEELSNINYIIHLGESSHSEDLQFESRATNFADFKIADNLGNQIQNTKILNDSEDFIESSIDLNELMKLEISVKVSISSSAGSFVCNELFFRSLDHFNKTNIKVAFFHIPSSLCERVSDMKLFKNSMDIILNHLSGKEC